MERLTHNSGRKIIIELFFKAGNPSDYRNNMLEVIHDCNECEINTEGNKAKIFIKTSSNIVHYDIVTLIKDLAAIAPCDKANITVLAPFFANPGDMVTCTEIPALKGHWTDGLLSLYSLSVALYDSIQWNVPVTNGAALINQLYDMQIRRSEFFHTSCERIEPKKISEEENLQLAIKDVQIALACHGKAVDSDTLKSVLEPLLRDTI